MKNIRIRLIVALPLTLTLFTLASGLFTLRFTHYYFRESPFIPPSKIMLTQVIWVLIMGLMALVAGTMMAYAIINPIKKILQRLETVSPPTPVKDHNDELSALVYSFDHFFKTFQNLPLNQQLLENLTQGVMTLSPGGIIIGFNRVAEAILGYPASQIIGRPFQQVFSDGPGNRDIIRKIESCLTQGKSYPLDEFIILNHEGSPISLAVDIAAVMSPKGHSADNHKAHLLGVIVTFHDLIGAKELREQLRRTDQLVALGTLAAGLAHEIRNPLGSIQGLVELLREDMTVDDPRVAYSDTILKTVDHLNRLVGELLGFARPATDQTRPEDINCLLEHALLQIHYSTTNNNIEVIKNLTPERPLILADAEKLTQALTNILHNACQSMPSGGRITVSTTVQPPAFVTISITNTGSYIPPGEQEKIFYPFYTTRKEGTGLGLSIAYQIIAAHSGTIRVESWPEKGTRFQITLPAAT